VTVGEQDKDIYTPKYEDGNGKPGTKVEIPLTEENGKDIPTGTTFESDQPEVITVDKDGKVTVTIPADKNPGDKITGKVTVTYPDGSKEEVPVKVTVTTPARKTPTVELSQDPTTGDVTVTPKKPDGSTYPEGTIVELPGKDGRSIKVTIGADGSAKVPNDQLPDTTVVGNAKITEPGKAAVEVPNVTTPAKVTPATPETEKPGKIEITQQPNGNAIVTPKKPDGSTYPRGTKVEIPGENGTTITVTIGDNGSGEVPNDKLPKGAVPGKGRVTEPNKKPSQPVDVTTPARKTPTVELSQDPTTGDVTVTPKKPDGSTYPEGTIVELPGKDGRPIKVTIGADGSAKVPNDQLPDTTVVGNAKITEPGKAAVEVPNVTTPAKVTVSTEQPSKSHNVLPNTGTESNATLASLGLLGMLSGLGFAFRKKKED
ncbi:YPDG domain-containing protein, partial [Streptococcus pseudopneumoniae]|uniref:YPDG domain-containing protein n=1 Tax=Streptococcus pseudopneumoniae TaxID=257758 RepID=UPI0014193273